nr:hypothetical protein DY000_00020757 [Ipomoea batatas]
MAPPVIATVTKLVTATNGHMVNSMMGSLVSTPTTRLGSSPTGCLSSPWVNCLVAFIKIDLGWALVFELSLSTGLRPPSIAMVADLTLHRTSLIRASIGLNPGQRFLRLLQTHDSFSGLMTLIQADVLVSSIRFGEFPLGFSNGPTLGLLPPRPWVFLAFELPWGASQMIAVLLLAFSWCCVPRDLGLPATDWSPPVKLVQRDSRLRIPLLEEFSLPRRSLKRGPRGVDIDLTCPCCNEEDETIDYALFKCKEAQAVWHLSPYTDLVPTFQDYNSRLQSSLGGINNRIT